jgi:hypothetical protein
MPTVDGVELCRQLKRETRHCASEATVSYCTDVLPLSCDQLERPASDVGTREGGATSASVAIVEYTERRVETAGVPEHESWLAPKTESKRAL